MRDKLFKQDAKQMVDMFFDQRLFNDNVTRDDMSSLEEFLSWLLQSKFDSHLRCEKLLKQIKIKDDNN